VIVGCVSDVEMVVSSSCLVLDCMLLCKLAIRDGVLQMTFADGLLMKVSFYDDKRRCEMLSLSLKKL
jgi:hypothetical protein